MKRRILFFSLLVLALLMVAFGLWLGEGWLVLERGMAVCLSCIGIG